MNIAIVSEPMRFESGTIRIAAIALSMLLHILLVVTYGGQPMAASERPQPSEIRLSFLTPAPEPAVIPEAEPEPEPKKPEVKPEPKPEPVQKVVEKALPEKAPEPMPEAVQAFKPEPVAVPRPVAIAPAPVAQPQINEGLIRRDRERYLANVLSRIEQFKRYPRLARRRGIEGDVTVRFMLHHDGSVHQLLIENGPALLITAARRTIERALPMPSPPAGVDCPLECKFRLSFHLKRS